MADFQAFVAGPPRSGTSTICYALQRAGMFAVHGSDPVSDIPLAVVLNRAIMEGRDPLFYLARGITAVADPHVTRSPKWDSSSYWPTFVPGFFRSLRQHHPDAWVILNTRDPADWIASVNRWKDLRARLIKADLPFLPPGMGGRDEDLVNWIEAYYGRVRSDLAGDPRLVEFDIADPGAHHVLAERTGWTLPWWGQLNANPPEPVDLAAKVVAVSAGRLTKTAERGPVAPK